MADNYHPIAVLTPFIKGSWTIKARVIQKDDEKKELTSKKTQETFGLRTITLEDDDETAIRATLFGDAADMDFELNATYTLSNGSIRNANKRYSSCGNDYELSFDSQDKIKKVTSAPKGGGGAKKFFFVPLESLPHKAKSCVVDVLAAIHEVSGEVVKVTTRATSTRESEEVSKRVVTVAAGKARIELTVWGQQAEGWSWMEPGTVLALRNARVSHWEGTTSIAMTLTGEVTEGKGEQADALKKWYENNAAEVDSLPNLSKTERPMAAGFPQRRFLEDIGELDMGKKGKDENGKDQPDWLTVRGYIANAKTGDSMWYKAHPQTKRKVQPDDDGYAAAPYRYILPLMVSDATGHRWATCFDDVAASPAVLNVAASKLEAQNREELEARADPEKGGRTKAVDEAIQQACWRPMVLKFRVLESELPASDEFGGETRRFVKCSVQWADRLSEKSHSWTRENRIMLRDLDRYKEMSTPMV